MISKPLLIFTGRSMFPNPAHNVTLGFLIVPDITSATVKMLNRISDISIYEQNSLQLE